jgi:hypothetical protein
MTPHTASKGSTFFIGRPAKPMSSERASAITSLVQRVGGIREAHLPQCYNPDSMPAPAQVLVVVFAPGFEPQARLQALGEGLVSILPTGEHLDVLPLAESSGLLSNVRGAQMQIFAATPAPKKSFLQRLFGR